MYSFITLETEPRALVGKCFTQAISLYLLLFIQRATHQVTKIHLEFVILLPQLPKYLGLHVCSIRPGWAKEMVQRLRHWLFFQKF